MANATQEFLGHFIRRDAFVSKYRYYASILARLIPVEDRSIPVMAVSTFRSKFYLHVNVDYFSQLDYLKYLPGVLLHEVHHVVLGHLTNPAFREVDQPRLMEIAMEISANEYICEPLPGDPPKWKHYLQFGIGADQSTMERYELFRKAHAASKIAVMACCVDSHLAGGVGAIYPNIVREIGGNGHLQRLLSAAIHEANSDGEGNGQLAGRDPGHFLETLPDTDEDDRTFLDWKTALDMFIAMQRESRTTYMRPNRRFLSRIGEIPGRIHYPGRSKPKHMLVAIDTSGSMSRKELIQIAKQLRSLRDHVEFTVVECDTMIHRVYPFEDRLKDVAGRGGTDLRPVFDDAFLNEHHVDGVIYFTDGMGPFPIEDPGTKTLWVLTKPWDFGCDWGQRAFMRVE